MPPAASLPAPKPSFRARSRDRLARDAGGRTDNERKIYELGPEPEPDDIDGRSPAVVVWADGELFCLVASSTMLVQELVKIAKSLYVL